MNLGVALGAGLYETRIVLPLWFGKTQSGYTVNPAMREIDTGRKFWGMVTTMPLTLLTIANLVLAFQANGALRGWWLAAGLITLLERIGTFAFFIPTAIKLQKSVGTPATNVNGLVAAWVNANYARSFLNLVGLIAAMRVLMLI